MMTTEQAQTELHSVDKWFNEQTEQLKLDYAIKRRNVMNEWAMDHARFSIGDIIKTDSQIIQITGISGDYSYYAKNKTAPLYICYSGVRLTKKLTPYKDGSVDMIYDDGRTITKIK